MSLSCECNTDYDYGYYYTQPNDYSNLQTKRRKRCMSCNGLIDIGAICLIFPTWRSPNSDIEERIYGDEVGLADKYMCEDCGDIFFNLVNLGFCINTGIPMKEQLREYQNDYAPPRLQAVD